MHVGFTFRDLELGRKSGCSEQIKDGNAGFKVQSEFIHVASGD